MRRLRDRRVDHARRAVAVEQAGGDLEEPAQRRDVLADHEHRRIALHLLVQRLVQRLGDRQLADAVVGDAAHDSRPGVSQAAGA